MVGHLGLLFVALLLADLHPIMLLIPLLERGRIDLDDATLHECVGADELIVGRVVHHIQDANLASHRFGGPREIASVQPQSAVLGVAATRTHGTNALVPNLGVRGLATKLKFAVHAPFGELSSGLATLMERVTRNAHCASSL